MCFPCLRCIGYPHDDSCGSAWPTAELGCGGALRVGVPRLETPQHGSRSIRFLARQIGLLGGVLVESVKLRLLILKAARTSLGVIDDQLPWSITHRFGTSAAVAKRSPVERAIVGDVAFKSSGERSTPSSGRSAAGCNPASDSNVGMISSVMPGTSLLLPASILPGHQAMKGTLCPPS